MMEVEYSEKFEKKFNKIKDKNFKSRISKHMFKIVSNPRIGKPMRYDRLGTRELYLESHRISYVFEREKLCIIFMDLYHKDEQ